MPNLKRDIKKLDRKTGRKTTIKSGVPHSRDGQDGDITLRKTPNGHELFAKMDGLWYGTRLERIQGTVKRALHGRVAFDTGKKEDKPPKGKRGSSNDILSLLEPKNKTTRGRRNNNDIISNIVTKNRKTNDVVLKNSKPSTASPNLKLFNDTVGGTGASYIPTLQFIKSPASGLTAMADGDSLGLIAFLGDDDDSTDGSVGYGTIRCIATDVTHATKNSRLEFSTLHDGTTLQTMTLDGKDLTVTGTVTATTGFATTGTWTFDEYTSGTIGITSVQDSGTTFNDNDTSLMTAAAIADKIEAYGYSTTAGDITGVTAGTGLSGGGSSGAVTLTNAGVTSLVATANETTVSGATGAVTIGLPDDVTIGGDLTVTGDVTVNGNNINYDLAHSYLSIAARTGTDEAGYRLNLESGQGTGTSIGGAINMRVSLAGGSSNDTANSRTTIMGINGSGNVGLRATSKLNFDDTSAAGNTYIQESSADILDIYVGGDKALSLDENTGYLDVDDNWNFRAGDHGDGTRLKLTPADFTNGNIPNTRAYGPGIKDDGGSAFVGNTSENFWCLKVIPLGYTATHVRVNCSHTISAVEVFEGQIDDATAVSKGTGDTNALIDITDVDATSDNYLIIEVDSNATNNYIYGGLIRIAKIT